jgi:hypothetical protein
MKKTAILTGMAVFIAIALLTILVVLLSRAASGRRMFYTDAESGSVKQAWMNGLEKKEELLYQAPNFDANNARWTLGADDELGRLKPGEWLVLTNGTGRTIMTLESFDARSGRAVMMVRSENGPWRRNIETNGMPVLGGMMFWRNGGGENSMVVCSPLLFPGGNSTAMRFPVSKDFAQAFIAGETNAPEMYSIGRIPDAVRRTK